MSPSPRANQQGKDDGDDCHLGSQRRVRHQVWQAGCAGRGTGRTGRTDGSEAGWPAGCRRGAGCADRAFLARRGGAAGAPGGNPVRRADGADGRPQRHCRRRRCPVPAVRRAASGRWVNATNWVFDFERDLPPGMRCTRAHRQPGSRAWPARPTPASRNTGSRPAAPRWYRPGHPAGRWKKTRSSCCRFNGAATAGSIRRTRGARPRAWASAFRCGCSAGKERTDVIAAVGWTEIAKREARQSTCSPASEAARRRADAARARCGHRHALRHRHHGTRAASTTPCAKPSPPALPASANGPRRPARRCGR